MLTCSLKKTCCNLRVYTSLNQMSHLSFVEIVKLSMARASAAWWSTPTVSMWSTQVGAVKLCSSSQAEFADVAHDSPCIYCARRFSAIVCRVCEISNSPTRKLIFLFILADVLKQKTQL